MMRVGLRALVTIEAIVREARMTGPAATGTAVRGIRAARKETGEIAAGGKSASRFVYSLVCTKGRAIVPVASVRFEGGENV